MEAACASLVARKKKPAALPGMARTITLKDCIALMQNFDRLERTAVPRPYLSVPLTALSVHLTALSVRLTALSVPLTAISVPFAA